MLKYRPEIDGLRALAVLPVLLFHAGISFFSGGYIGVDIFFVISGYLITSVILQEKEAGIFRLSNFYERRIRRILPALFFVMLCCLPFAYAWMMPDILAQFSKNLYGVVFFFSNIQLIFQQGYFSPLAEENPLLHTWSLAVEEQYYIVFPLFIMMFWHRGKKTLVALIILVLLGSLILSDVGTRHHPTANFYLVLTRAWEILFGALCGFYLFKRDVKPNQILSLIGVGLIGFSILFFDQATPFPSFYALIPVVGTCLVILYTNQKTALGQVLSYKPIVMVGLMSYSLYLWHQPLFAFARLRLPNPPSLEILFTLSLVTFVLAYLTWRYIETPFRDRHNGLSKKAVYSTVFCFSIFFVALGGVGDKTNGFSQRLNPKTQMILNIEKGDTSDCHNKFKTDLDRIKTGDTCQIGDKNAVPKIAIIGDSQASRLTNALASILIDQGRSAITYNASWCVPLLGVKTQKKEKRHCFDFVKNSFEAALNNPNIETIILSGQWANITQGQRWGEKQKTLYSFFDDNEKDNSAVFNAALAHTVKILKTSNKDVIVIGPIPEFETHIPQSLAKFHHFGYDGIKHQVMSGLFVSRSDYDRRNGAVLEALASMEKTNKITILDPYPLYCGRGFCTYESVDGLPFYEDNSHLTKIGSIPLVEALVKNLEQVSSL